MHTPLPTENMSFRERLHAQEATTIAYLLDGTENEYAALLEAQRQLGQKLAEKVAHSHSATNEHWKNYVAMLALKVLQDAMSEGWDIVRAEVNNAV